MRKILFPLNVLLIVFSCVGCEDGMLTFKWSLQDKKPDIEDGFVDPSLGKLVTSGAFRDTVAEQAWIEGLRFMQVRGFGVVAGLGTRGSSECPTRIRDRLVQDIYKRRDFSGRGLKRSPITPDRLLDDKDTAVVVVEGQIPAAALKGARFDLTVRALPGTQTTSLEGGRLYTTDMRVYRDTSGGAPIEGKILATASGPIFINPFGDREDAVTKRNPREGIILGGGEVKVARRVRIVLTSPSYQRAQRVNSVINSRFPAHRKTAEAPSPSFVNIRIPRAYRHDAFHFLSLVRHLYLPARQGFADERAQELAVELLDETAPHPDIALAWEGIGRTALPVVQKLYTEERLHARFYAAVTGLRLGDDVAVEVLRDFAYDEKSRYRLTAIDELGHAQRTRRAADVLRELLDDADPRIRVEAYEALLARGDRTISTQIIGGDDFALDQVITGGRNLIYIRRTGAPRIALFGSTIRCRPPVLYQDPKGLITISAESHDRDLTLMRRTLVEGRSSPPLAASLDVAELIGMLGDKPRLTSATEVHGLALDYSTIAHALYEMCTTDSINARFMVQQKSVTEMFGPLDRPGRAETDL